MCSESCIGARISKLLWKILNFHSSTHSKVFPPINNSSIQCSGTQSPEFTTVNRSMRYHAEVARLTEIVVGRSPLVIIGEGFEF